MEVIKNKYMFISKKALINNYENQLKRKEERIGSLLKENKELKNHIEKNAEKVSDLLSENKELEYENKNLLNEKIDRIKKLKYRTSKFKVKNKCDNRMLKLEKRDL